MARIPGLILDEDAITARDDLLRRCKGTGHHRTVVVRDFEALIGTGLAPEEAAEDCADYFQLDADLKDLTVSVEQARYEIQRLIDRGALPAMARAIVKAKRNPQSSSIELEVLALDEPKV